MFAELLAIMFSRIFDNVIINRGGEKANFTTSTTKRTSGVNLEL